MTFLVFIFLNAKITEDITARDNAASEPKNVGVLTNSAGRWAPHTKTRDFGRICQAMRNTVSESSWIDERELLKKLSDKIDLRRKQESINPVENHLTLLLTGIDSRSEARKTIRFEANPKQKDDKRGEKFTDIIADSISEHDFSKLGIRANQSSVINEDNSTNVCRCDDDCFGNQKCCLHENGSLCYDASNCMRFFNP